MREKLFYLVPVLNTMFTNGKWNFPLIRIVKDFYKKHGLILTILWVLLVVVGTKVVFINGTIGIINYTFGIDIPFGPVWENIRGNFGFVD